MPDLHLPDRSTWQCSSCGNEWPCVAAMRTIEQDFAEQLPSRGLYLVGKWYDAMVDMPHADPDELYRRIVAWPHR